MEGILVVVSAQSKNFVDMGSVPFELVVVDCVSAWTCGFPSCIELWDTICTTLSVATHYLDLYSNSGFVCVELCTFVTKAGILGKIGQNQMSTSF